MIIENITKKYNEKIVLDNVSLSINEGKITSFIGPNGAGKSTLMHIISRLNKSDSGKVIFKGKDLKDWNNKDLAKSLAILTQSNNINIKLSVKDLVSFGRFPYSKNNLNKTDLAKINEALDFMALKDLQNAFLDELSGGQMQRALIAMIIAQDTEYVLFDEPTNNLDIAHSISMMKNIKKLCDELGKTIIMVLHELNLASFYSDYICAFKDGKVANYGTSKEVITKENLKNIYGVDFEITQIKEKPLCLFY